MVERRQREESVAVERRRGRPRGAHPTERLDLRLPQPAYDALCRDAVRRGIPAATLARRVLMHFLSGDKSAAAISP